MKQANNAIELYRVTHGRFSSDARSGNNGAFKVPFTNKTAFIIASDGEGWEHVSVSFKDRNPTWTEMCRIKDLFWEEDEVVLQYHPAKSEYVNRHPHCLHLWKPLTSEVPTPPRMLVG